MPVHRLPRLTVQLSQGIKYARLSSTSTGNDLRELMRRVAQPVAVITIPSPADPEGPQVHGATLSSLSSISIKPPLVSFSLRLPSRVASYLTDQRKSRPFRLYLLSGSQETMARKFARQPNTSSIENGQSSPGFARDLFDQLERDALGSLVCEPVQSFDLSKYGEEQGDDASSVPDNAVRSALFIARIGKIDLGQSRDSAGSLTWFEHQYKTVK